MNERIDKLAEEAGLWNDMEPTRREGRYVGHMNVSDVEKFAELIVRECIGCCEEVADINKTYIEEKFVDPEFGPKECIEVIKKHFGVEQ